MRSRCASLVCWPLGPVAVLRAADYPAETVPAGYVRVTLARLLGTLSTVALGVLMVFVYAISIDAPACHGLLPACSRRGRPV